MQTIWQWLLLENDTLNTKFYTMGFSFFTQELAMDLGTANTLILMNDKVVVNEPSIVAYDQKLGHFFACGKVAKLMHEKTHRNIKTIRPLKDGVIADFNAAEYMIRSYIKMINFKRSLFTPNLRMVICIPSGSTEVEIRAVRDSAENAGARDVYLIYEPMAAALGIGLDVIAPTGNMVVDIGGGTTEIAVISLGGIVSSQSIKVAGDLFNTEIQLYLRQQHNVKIGESTAEAIKTHIGAAHPNLEEELEPYVVKGPNLVTSHPIEVKVTSQEIAHCLDKSISQIESSIIMVLESTPPEVYQDIIENGIYLTGGGALLKGLAQRLTDKINIPFHVAENPLQAVARGSSIAVKKPQQYPFLMR